MDRGAWQARVPRIAKSQTRLRQLSMHACVLLYNPMDCSLPSSSVHGILLARILEWVAMPSSEHLPNPGIELVSLCLLHWQVGSLPPVAF